MPDDFYFACQRASSNAGFDAPFDPDDGPTPSMGDDSTALTSVGLIFDRGLCADGVPAEQWAEHASDAVDVLHDVYLATLISEDWESSQASEVVTVAEALGALLYVVSARGTDVFHTLTSQDRHALSTASQLIGDVAQRFLGQMAAERPA